MSDTKLTDRKIRSLKPKATIYELSDDKVSSLSVRVHSSGKKNFFIRYEVKGKRRRFTLKPDYPALSLSAARERARVLLADVSRGVDPQGEKEEDRNADTFKSIVQIYRNHYLRNLKPKTQDFYNNIIDVHLLPEFGSGRLDGITRRDIIYLLDKIAFERDAPVMANRAKAVLSSILSFCVEKGYLEYNPALQVKNPVQEKARERVLTDEEIKLFWEATEPEDIVVRTLFQMLLLLGQRSSETKNMEWSEVREGYWEIPSAKTKANRLHIVPLPPLALDLLEELRPITGDSKYVFETPSNRKSGPIENIRKVYLRIQERCGVEFIIHDLRRTMATGLARRGINRTTIGKVINHKGLSGDHSVTAVYDRYDYMEEKRVAVNRWVDHLERVIKGSEKKVARVINLH